MKNIPSSTAICPHFDVCGGCSLWNLDTEEYYNFKTGNRLVSPMFFGIARHKPLLNFWVMDRTFSRNLVKAKLHRKLLAGMKYKNYVSTLTSLYLIKKN